MPETKNASDLLNELRARRSQIAIVLDEYGGVAGLVTLEDLLEALVGPIDDEHDVPTPEDPVVPLGGSRYEVDAAVPLEEINDRLGLHLPTDGDFQTVGGFAFNALGRLPARARASAPTASSSPWSRSSTTRSAGSSSNSSGTESGPDAEVGRRRPPRRDRAVEAGSVRLRDYGSGRTSRLQRRRRLASAGMGIGQGFGRRPPRAEPEAEAAADRDSSALAIDLTMAPNPIITRSPHDQDGP